MFIIAHPTQIVCGYNSIPDDGAQDLGLEILLVDVVNRLDPNSLSSVYSTAV